jgi:N-acetyltransferase
METTMELVFDTPIELSDGAISLRPLERSDKIGLATFAYDPDLWEHSVYFVYNEQQLDWFLDVSLNARDAGVRYPFCVMFKGQIIGTTSYGAISVTNRKLEIGWTWLARRFHGSGINKRVKTLMIDHAFRGMGFERIEFQTDVRNLRARKSIEKLGSSLEGILRSHLVLPNGSRRDSAVYSILKEEWLRSSLLVGHQQSTLDSNKILTAS